MRRCLYVMFAWPRAGTRARTLCWVARHRAPATATASGPAQGRRESTSAANASGLSRLGLPSRVASSCHRRSSRVVVVRSVRRDEGEVTKVRRAGAPATWVTNVAAARTTQADSRPHRNTRSDCSWKNARAGQSGARVGRMRGRAAAGSAGRTGKGLGRESGLHSPKVEVQ